MAFIAECPFCRVKLQGVPAQRAGASTECPRCHNLFTLAPMVNPPKLRPAPVKTAAPAPAPGPVDRPAAATLVAPARPPARASGPPTGAGDPGQTTVLPPAAAAPVLAEWPTTPAAPGPGNTMGIVSFMCGSAALLTASLPYLGVATIPLSGLGLLLGLLALKAAASGGGRLAFAGAGVTVSLPVLLLAALWPGLLGGADRAPAGTSTDPRQLMVPLAAKGGDREVTDDSAWVDMSLTASLRHGDVRLGVTAAGVQPVDLKGRKPPKEKYLVLGLRLENLAARQLDYRSWGESGPTLTDNLGKTYRLKTFSGGEVVGHVRRATLLPGKTVEDVLVFDAPGPNIGYLHLELPAAAVGGGGAFHLEIPWRMLTHR